MKKIHYFKYVLTAFLLMLMCSKSLYATDYYVAPDVLPGNGSGTSGDPWELMYAVNNVTAESGHSIILKSGTYTVSQPINLPRGISLKGKGADASLIVLTADNDLDNDALLRLVGDQGSLPSLTGPSFDGNQEISNFTIYGKDVIKTGVSVIGRNNVKIKYMRVIDFDLLGIVFSGAQGNGDSLNTKISGSEIAYCYIENSAGVSNRPSSYYSGNIQHGGWSGGSIHHNTIIDFAAGNEGGIGMKSHNGGHSWNVEVHHNFIICPSSAYRWGTQFTIEFDNPYGNMQFYNNIFQDGGTSLTHGPDGYRTIDGKPNLIIKDNIFFNAQQPIELYTEYTEVYGNYLEDCGGSFAVAHTSAMKNMTFHHNTLINCNIGIHMKNADDAISENLLFYNNLLKGVNEPFIASNGQSNNIDVKNNIFQDCGTIWSSSDGNIMSNVNFDYNLFQNNTVLYSGTSPDFGSNNITGSDPGLNLSGYLYTTYYSPSSASSAVVDAGNDVGDITAGFQGTAPDIGAFEFGTPTISVTGIFMPIEIAMYPSDVKRLYAFIEPWQATPASTITWSATDNSVASVDQDGYVTANALGDAHIVVDVDGFKDSTLVRVVHVDIDSLQITSSAVTLKKNDNITISLLFYPRHATDRTVSWSSKDNTIASVSGGTITGHASGETFVYATSNDNGFKDSVKVIVSTDKLPMAWWKFNNSNVNDIDDSWPAILKNGTSYSTESKEGTHSIKMTGNQEKIDISNENIRVAASKRTVMLWVKFVSFTDTMELYEEGGSKGGLVIRMDPDKKLKYRVMDNYVYGDIIVDYTFENQWTHVAAVLENNQMRLYLNGQEVGTKTLSFSVMGAHTNPAGLGFRADDDPFGENSNGLSLTMNGYLDDVQIYNAIMSAQEIATYLSTFGQSIPVTGFNIVESDVTMALTDTKSLTYSIEPNNATNKTVAWTTNQPAIVSVDNSGQIEALSLGNAMIIGETSDGGFSDTVYVSVVNQVVGVTIEQGDSAQLSLGQYINLSEIIEPSNATNKSVLWESNNESVATVDDYGLVVAVSEGYATITVTTLDGSFTDSITIIVGGTTAIEALPSNQQIVVFPNPLDGDKLSILMSKGEITGKLLISLTDISGRTIIKREVAKMPGNTDQYDLIIDKKVNPGLYVLELSSKNLSRYFKILIR